jgi:hypothetical protein
MIIKSTGTINIKFILLNIIINSTEMIVGSKITINVKKIEGCLKAFEKK